MRTERSIKEVLVVASSTEAIRLAHEHRGSIDLITDVVMPGINGRELARSLLSPGSQTAVHVGLHS
jgi:CheY-like chemotaxis protein